MEVAAGGRRKRAGHIATDRRLTGAAGRIGHRHRRQQCLGVGMAWRTQHDRGRSGLDEAPEIHHAHVSRDLAHHREVVRDEDIAECELALQVGKQIEDLRLNRHIERRDRLVADDHPRSGGERAGNRQALALPAREFMRIAACRLGGQPDHAEQLGDPRSAPCCRHGLVQHQWLGEHVTRGQARIERAIGILEDQLDQAAQAAHG